MLRTSRVEGIQSCQKIEPSWENTELWEHRTELRENGAEGT